MEAPEFDSRGAHQGRGSWVGGGARKVQIALICGTLKKKPTQNHSVRFMPKDNGKYRWEMQVREGRGLRP